MPRSTGRRIVTVRHGEAYNTVRPDGRRPVVDPANPPLTPLGERQAGLAAVEMVRLAPDRVLSSPFLRAAQTAQAFLRRTDTAAAFDIRLGEQFAFESLSHFGGIRADLVRRHHVDRIDTAGDLPSDAFPHYPEPLDAVDRRVGALVDQWRAAPGWQCLAIYSHGAVLGAVARSLTPGFPPDPNPRHCALTEFVEGVDGWTMARASDTRHLAPIGDRAT